VKILLPSDVVVADKFAADANTQVVSVDAIPEGWMGLDIGPDSIASFQKVGPARRSLPRHPTHFEPSFIDTRPPFTEWQAGEGLACCGAWTRLIAAADVSCKTLTINSCIP